MRLGLRSQVATCLLSVVLIGDFVRSMSAGRADDSALQVTRHTIDGGGSMRAIGGMYELSGTIGQPEAGLAAGGEYQVSAAFWFPVPAGDSGDDGTVDLNDYAAFHACSTGPGGTVSIEECQCFDVDDSDTVDLADFAIIQRSYTGA